MPEALSPYDPRLLPVPYGRAAPQPGVPAVLPDQRGDVFRAEPIRSVHEAQGSGTRHALPDDRSAFVAQQIAHEHRLQLARPKPLTGGYAAYAAAAQQSDPGSRPGQKVDVSI